MANTFFRKHQTYVAAGNLVGPLVVISAYPFIGANGVFLTLAIISFLVWVICGTTMTFSPDESIPLTSNEPSRVYSSFVRSLLYNQVPLRSFLNRRSLLAQFTLFMAWTCATFVLPFYTIYLNDKDVV